MVPEPLRRLHCKTSRESLPFPILLLLYLWCDTGSNTVRYGLYIIAREGETVARNEFMQIHVHAYTGFHGGGGAMKPCMHACTSHVFA